MGIITLEGIEFFAYHGYFKEERKIGNKYSIDIVIETDLSEAARTDNLKATVNYEQLYQIARAVMEEKAKLLEHLAQRIIDRIYEKYPQIQSAEVSVSKFNPPVGGVCHRSKVTLKK
jgi:7,8-dihydroneopterin aldolase/epimerase/oxygenase